MTKLSRKKVRKIRHRRVRSRVSGTAERPRLSVFKSNKFIYASLIDDVSGKTILSASSQNSDKKTKKVDASFKVGKDLATGALALKITEIVFDRGGYQYIGRIKSLAEGAREGGLKF